MPNQSAIIFFFRFIGWFTLAQVALWVLQTHTFFVPEMQNSLAIVSGSIYGLFGGSILVSENFLLSQVSGRYLFIDLPCLGLNMCAGLIALQLSANSSWARRMLAVCCGLVILQMYNCIRIAHLFSIVETNIGQFSFYHLFIWQSINMIVLVTLNVGLALLFHPTSLFTRFFVNLRPVRLIVHVAIYAPVLFGTEVFAFGGGGGGGSGGSGGGVPFIELDLWQYCLLIALLIVFKARLNKYAELS